MKKTAKLTKIENTPYILQVKDKRILSILCTDARASLKKIAKQVGLSPEGVAYRIKRLEEQGIIWKYSIYPDEYRFGLQVYHIYFKFHTLPSQKEDIFKQALEETGFCSLIRKTRGHWDFIVIFFAQSPFHLDELLSGLFENQNFSIKAYRAHFVAHQHCFSQLVSDTFRGFEDPYRRIIPLRQRLGANTLDERELLFLKALDANSRSTYAEMSEMTAIPQETLRAMLNRLREEGVIITTFAALDKFKLGLTVTAMDILLKVNAPSVYRSLVEHLVASQYVHYSAKITGAAELHVVLLTRDSQQFVEELERIRGQFYEIIEDIEIHPIYAEEALSMFPRRLHSTN